MPEIVSISLYAISWFVLFVMYYRNSKSIGIAGTIMLVYGSFALTSIYFYYNAPNNREIFNITFSPFIYLFCCICICILPLMKYNKYIESIPIRPQRGTFRYMKIFLTSISPLILLCFTEISMLAYNANSVSLADAYSSSTFSVGSQLTRLGRLGYTIAHWGAYIWPMLFFYCLIIKQTRISIIPLLAYCIEIMQGYVSGDRVTLVRFILYIGIVYYLLRNSIDNSTKKKVKLVGSIVGGVLFLGISLITIGRLSFHNDQLELGGFLSLYSGEGCIRFSQYIWELDKTSNGDTCFSLIKSLLGFDTFIDNNDRRFFYERYFNIPTFIFYTFVGDLYQDFGLIGTVIFCCAFAFILKKTICKIIKKGKADFQSIFLISIILQTYLFGFMYYNFKTYNDQLQLIAPFIFWWVLDMTGKQKRWIN